MRIECCWFRVLGSRVTGSGLRLTVHCSCCTFRFPMVWALCGVAARDFFLQMRNAVKAQAHWRKTLTLLSCSSLVLDSSCSLRGWAQSEQNPGPSSSKVVQPTRRPDPSTLIKPLIKARKPSGGLMPWTTSTTRPSSTALGVRWIQGAE